VKASILLMCSTIVLVLTCAAPSKVGPAGTSDSPSGMALVSAAFTAGETIPTRYTLYGENLTPDLSWEKAPESARSFALICRDPDAPGGTFIHWVLFNIPENVKGLPEGLGREPTSSFGGTQGTNSFGRIGYDGPKPPTGTHRYYFDLYALDGMLDLDSTATAGRVQQAMKGHVLAEASLMGKYAR
jgi:Raf kinase inhibitor-like YbhB/YbcL family protein